MARHRSSQEHIQWGLRSPAPDILLVTKKGKLDLGPWKQISYGEFDNRRRERVLVRIIGE